MTMVCGLCSNEFAGVYSGNSKGHLGCRDQKNGINQTATAATVGGKEEEGEEDVPALIRKKSRKGDWAKAEQDVVEKRRKNERARKAGHEQPREPREEVAEKREKNRVAIDIELPITPLMKIPEATTSAPIDVEETEEPSGQREEDTEQRLYAPDWTIYLGTQLTRSLVRAKWVARALLSAKIAAYSWAQMFDICNIANQAAVLVRIEQYCKVFFYDCE